MLAASRILARPVARHCLQHQKAAAAAIAAIERASLTTTASHPNRWIINAVGQDRVGIVSEVTGLVIDAGGNVGQSQAATLGDHFSLMMLVELPSDADKDLAAKLSTLPNLEAALFAAPHVEDAAKQSSQVGWTGIFTLSGADNPGIAHKLTTALAHHGLTIDKMETSQSLSPFGGTTLFHMRGRTKAMAPLANGFDPDKIADELVRLGNSLNCDVALEEAGDDDAAFEASMF